MPLPDSQKISKLRLNSFTYEKQVIAIRVIRSIQRDIRKWEQFLLQVNSELEYAPV